MDAKDRRREANLLNSGYTITLDGKVYNPSGTEIGFVKEGCKIVSVKEGGISRQLSVHRLQGFKKFGNRIYENGMEVYHIDNNLLNNSWNNIGIGTKSNTMMSMSKDKRVAKATHASRGNVLYNHDEVNQFYQENRSYKKTMEKFGIASKSTLNAILKKYK